MKRPAPSNAPFARLTLLVLAVVGLALLSAGASAANAQTRPLGDSKVFAPFPADPGFPESIAVHQNRVYVAGPAQFGSFVQPKVIAYDLDTGAQVAVYPIQGQNPAAPQAGTGIAFGKNDMLYVGDLQLGVVRFDVDLGPNAPQEHYASALPDIQPCSVAPAPCSPTVADAPPLINDLAFGKSGKLYVALAASNQISVLRPDGTEEARYGGPAANPGGLIDPLPYANPSAFAFNDKTRSLLMTNHAIFFPAPEPFFAVIDVYVNDKGDKLATPNIK